MSFFRQTRWQHLCQVLVDVLGKFAGFSLSTSTQTKSGVCTFWQTAFKIMSFCKFKNVKGELPLCHFVRGPCSQAPSAGLHCSLFIPKFTFCVSPERNISFTCIPSHLELLLLGVGLFLESLLSVCYVRIRILLIVMPF